VVVISSGQTVRVIARSRHFSRPGWSGVCRPAPAILRRIWLVRSLSDPATAATALKPSLVVVVGHMDRLRDLQPRRSLRAAVPERNGTERTRPWSHSPIRRRTRSAISHGNWTYICGRAAHSQAGSFKAVCIGDVAHDRYSVGSEKPQIWQTSCHGSFGRFKGRLGRGTGSLARSSARQAAARTHPA
jgi:hypothetical protein